MSKTIIQPFSDESLSVGGEFHIESSDDQIAIYGSLTLTRDVQGMANAQILLNNLQRIVDAFVAEKNQGKLISSHTQTSQPLESVKNPW